MGDFSDDWCPRDREEPSDTALAYCIMCGRPYRDDQSTGKDWPYCSRVCSIDAQNDNKED